MFKTEARVVPADYMFSKLRFISPEEMPLLDKQDERILCKNELTPVWVLGCMLYQAHFKNHPFQTHLLPKVSYHMIRKYPVTFGREVDEGLKECIIGMLEKDPLMRLGCEHYEDDILACSYFTSQHK